jgi:hypothetical protein
MMTTIAPMMDRIDYIRHLHAPCTAGDVPPVPVSVPNMKAFSGQEPEQARGGSERWFHTSRAGRATGPKRSAAG